MKLNIIVFISGLFFIFSCDTNKSPYLTDKKLTVSFCIDDSTIQLKDNFKILFINKSDTLKPLIMDNRLKLPALHEKNYSVCFIFNTDKLCFDNVATTMIIADQDIEWRFLVDNRPFNNEVFSKEELEKDTATKQIQCMQFDVKEHGDGVQLVNKISL